MRILLTGARGQLGTDLASVLSGQIAPGGIQCLLGDKSNLHPFLLKNEIAALDHGTLAVEDRSCVLQTVFDYRPEIIIHSAAWTGVDLCESDPEKAYRINSFGTRNMQEAARSVGAHFCYISTDYVFDGTKTSPYLEWDAPNPMSVYGKSKLGGEFECDESATIVRTSWVAGVSGANMAKTVQRIALTPNAPIKFVCDQIGSPTMTADLASAVATLSLEKVPGVFHVTNSGTASWFTYAKAVLGFSGLDEKRVQSIETKELTPPRPAPRPANSVLENSALKMAGWTLLPDWEDALGRLVSAMDSTPS